MIVYVFKACPTRARRKRRRILLRPIRRQTGDEWMSDYASTSEGYITNELWSDIIIGKLEEARSRRLECA